MSSKKIETKVYSVKSWNGEGGRTVIVTSLREFGIVVSEGLGGKRPNQDGRKFIGQVLEGRLELVDGESCSVWSEDDDTRVVVAVAHLRG